MVVTVFKLKMHPKYLNLLNNIKNIFYYKMLTSFIVILLILIFLLLVLYQQYGGSSPSTSTSTSRSTLSPEIPITFVNPSVSNFTSSPPLNSTTGTIIANTSTTKNIRASNNNLGVSMDDKQDYLKTNGCYSSSDLNTDRMNLYVDNVKIPHNSFTYLNPQNCQLTTDGITFTDVFIIRTSGLYSITYKLNSLCISCTPHIVVNHSPIELTSPTHYPDGTIFTQQLCLSEGDQFSLAIKNPNTFDCEFKQMTVDVNPCVN